MELAGVEAPTKGNRGRLLTSKPLVTERNAETSGRAIRLILETDSP
jgi:hypothetical protein